MAASSRAAIRRPSGRIPPSATPIGARSTALSGAGKMAEPPLLELADIETSYGQSRVLFGITLSIAPGEMVSLMGRNGMGKTTTVRSIMGLTPAAAGIIRFNGADIRRLAPYRVARYGIGLVPEGRQVFPNLTTRENLLATASNRRRATSPWTLATIET